jgi:[ribosomal protein S5]-alanine N-acetyltransferase
MKKLNLPPYAVFPVLTGEKCTLRQIVAADLPDLMVISYYDAVQATSVEVAAQMNAKIEEDYLAGNTVHWGIADAQTGRIVGTCGYYRGFEHDTGELGCVLLPQYRGQGFMTAALRLALHFGAEGIGLKRIIAITTEENAPAIRLLKRLNFVKKDNLTEFILYF